MNYRYICLATAIIQGTPVLSEALDIKEWINNKIADDMKPKNEQLWRESWLGFQDTAYMFFSAVLMHADTFVPDTSFMVQHQQKELCIRAWKMLPSYQKQRDIALSFVMPNNYDVTKPVTLTLCVLTTREPAKGKAVCIDVALDVQRSGNCKDIDLQHIQATFMVKGSFNNQLAFSVLEIDISPFSIQPLDWVTLLFSRIEPGTEEEYDQKIYLHQAALRYEIL